MEADGNARKPVPDDDRRHRTPTLHAERIHVHNWLGRQSNKIYIDLRR